MAHLMLENFSKMAPSHGGLVRMLWVSMSDSHYQSTLDAVDVYVVPWSEFPIFPVYPHYPQGLVRKRARP